MTGRNRWLAAELRRRIRHEEDGLRAATGMFVGPIVSLRIAWPIAIVLAVWP